MALARIMLEFWSNFAASGDPNGAAFVRPSGDAVSLCQTYGGSDVCAAPIGNEGGTVM